MRTRGLLFIGLVGTAWAGAAAVVFACGGSTRASCGPGTTAQGNECVGSDAGAQPDAAVDAQGDAEADTGCPSGRGPSMVRLPTPDGGSFCIDSTEVTNAQYAAFLKDPNKPTSSALPSVCMGTSSFAPGSSGAPTDCSSYELQGRDSYPVTCVSYCDSVAFCAWAGKRLCGRIGGGQVLLTDDVGDASINQWERACTSGGKYTYVYGSTYIDGSCVSTDVDSGVQPVASRASCQSPDPHYAGVFDLNGNAAEWVDACNYAYADGGLSQCLVVPGGEQGASLPCWEPVYTAPMPGFGGMSPGIGFRCCADQ